MRSDSSASSLLFLAAGFGIWAVAFVALYVANAIGCTFGWDRDEFVFGLTPQRLQLLVLLAIFLAAHVALVLKLRAQPCRGAAGPILFVRRVALVAAVAALAASVLTYAGIFALSACV